MLALGEQYGGKVWSLLDDDEVRELSIVMSTLGTVEADVVEDLLLEFVSRMSASGALMGTFDGTERLLQQYLPAERVNGIMDEIRGPAGRNMWEKLSNVQEEVLANYLKNEYPQTIAVVLSKLKPEHAARVLAILPEDMALDVVGRMLKMEAVQKEVIERVEQTLAHRIHVEPVADPPPRRPRGDGGNLQQFRPPDRDPLHHLAGRGKPRIRRAHQGADVHLRRPDQARRRLGADADAQRRQGQARHRAEERQRGGPRRSSSATCRRAPARCCSTTWPRSGPVRLRDVDEAQALLVNLAKDLAAKGEIMLTKNRADDELVY